MGRQIMVILYCVDNMEIIQTICLPLKKHYTKLKSDEMTNELCTNMRNQNMCISYITRGYSNQILLCCSIIRMVSSFIQVKWKPTPPLPTQKKTTKKTKKPKRKTKNQTKTNKQTKTKNKKTKNKLNDIM